MKTTRLVASCAFLGVVLLGSRGHASPIEPPIPNGSALPIDLYFMMETDALIHSAEVEGENGFEIRRLRLGLVAHPLHWLTAVGIVEYASAIEPNVHVWEGYLDVAPWETLHLSFGYRRTPLFHIAKDELLEGLVVPELPLAIRSFWPGVDLGLEAHYLPLHVPLEAWARVGNGSGTPLGNDSDKLAYESRVDFVMGRPQLGTHERDPLGMRLGAGLHIGTLENEPGVGASTAGDYVFARPAIVNGLQSIGEAHLAVWLGRATVDMEVGRVIEERGQNSTGTMSAPTSLLPSAESWGGFVELAYMLWGDPRIPGAWPNAHPWNASLANGGIEIGGRFDFLSLDRDVPGTPQLSGVTASGAKGGEVAVRWWATSFLAVAMAGYYLRYDVPPVEEPTQRDSWLWLTRATFSWR